MSSRTPHEWIIFNFFLVSRIAKNLKVDQIYRIDFEEIS